MAAAEALIAEGKAGREDFPFGTDGFKAPTAEFIDAIEYDGKKPNEYLSKFPIGLKDKQKVAGNEVVGN
jgi:nitrate/nitrite transport system substrate-binding protein